MQEISYLSTIFLKIFCSGLVGKYLYREIDRVMCLCWTKTLKQHQLVTVCGGLKLTSVHLTHFNNGKSATTNRNHHHHHQHHGSTAVEILDFTKPLDTFLSPIKQQRSFEQIPVSLEMTQGLNYRYFFFLLQTNVDAISFKAQQQLPANCNRLILMIS